MQVRWFMVNGFVACCAVCVTGSMAAGVSQSDVPLVFEHVNVVRVQDGTIARNVTLAVANGRVIVPSQQRAPTGTVRVDARGWYAVPGLWDMHVHLNEDAAWALPLAAAAGVTGLRDMGGNLESVEALRQAASTPGLPRVLASGPIVTGVVDDDDPRMWQLRAPADAAPSIGRLASARVSRRCRDRRPPTLSTTAPRGSRRPKRSTHP